MNRKSIFILIMTGIACSAFLFTLNLKYDFIGKFTIFRSNHSDRNMADSELQKDSSDLPVFRFTPDNGETLAFHFKNLADVEIAFGFFSTDDAKGKIAVQNKAADKTSLKGILSGNLYLKFFSGESMGDVYKVAGRIENLLYTINDVPPYYKKAVSYPFIFQMSKNGSFSDFLFRNGIPEEAKQVVKNILYAMQTVSPEKPKTSWIARETDTTGRYLAKYQVKNDEKPSKTLSIEKKKDKYLRVHAAKSNLNTALTGSSVRVDESLIKTTLPKKGAWVISTHQNESTVMLSGATEISRSRITFSAERTSIKIKHPFPDDFGKVLSSLSSSDWFREKFKITDPVFNKLSENLDLNNALDVYTKMKNDEDSSIRRQAEKFMENYLKLNPMASYDLIGLLDKDPKRERFDHETQLILWRLITQAGHKDAQMAVLSAISNKEYSDLTHIRAMAYVHSFEYPEDFLYKGLWNFYHGIDPFNHTEREKELQTMALYAIGVLGSDEKQNEDIKPDIGQTLLENLDKAGDPNLQVIHLEAIGNYGRPDIIGSLEPYFSSDNEKVRMAAFHSLRRMKDPVAVDTLSKFYEKESSQKVRTVALKILAKMPPTQESITLARSEIMTAQEKEGQEALATVLGQNLKDYPDSEKTLRTFLKKDPPNRVKKTVYRFIKPQ